MAGRVVGRVVLESERLRLREFEATDAPLILRLLNEAGFLRFIGDRGVRTEADALAYIERVAVAGYRRHGFGLYRVERRDGGEAVGMCGLMRKAWLDAPDLAYALLAAFEGRGYATEAAAAVLAHARDELGLERVAAVVQPDNPGSIRVLEKLGFTRERAVTDPAGVELALFSLYFVTASE